MRLPLNNTPIGNIDCVNMSLVILTSLVPSSKCVVRCNTRVPIAYAGTKSVAPLRAFRLTGAHRESKMPCHKKHRVLEVEGIIQIVVVDDNS